MSLPKWVDNIAARNGFKDQPDRDTALLLNVIARLNLSKLGARRVGNEK